MPTKILKKVQEWGELYMKISNGALKNYNFTYALGGVSGVASFITTDE